MEVLYCKATMRKGTDRIRSESVKNTLKIYGSTFEQLRWQDKTYRVWLYNLNICDLAIRAEPVRVDNEGHQKWKNWISDNGEYNILCRWRSRRGNYVTRDASFRLRRKLPALKDAGYEGSCQHKGCGLWRTLSA